MANMHAKIAVVFLSLLLVIPFAPAQNSYEKIVDEPELEIQTYSIDTAEPVSLNEDFRAFASSLKTELCVLLNYEDAVEITNTGERPSEYIIGLSGDAARYATAVPDTFSLMPGESRLVYNYMHFPRDSAGHYELKTSIRTAGGLEKEITQEIDARLCNDNFVLAHNFNQSACPCLEMVYKFTIKNTGNDIESYTFGLDKFSEYSNISHNPLILGEGESENVWLYIKPDCGIYGQHVVNFYSIAEKSGIETRAPLLLNIRKCYDYNIRTGNLLDNDMDKFNATFKEKDAQYNVCAGSNKSIPIMIENTAYIGNNYFYQLAGEEWGGIYGNFVRLNGYERGFTYLDLSPGRDLTGEHKFVFNARSQLGNERKQKVITVDIVDCYGLLVETKKGEMVCDCENSEFSFDVTNMGRFKENIELQLDGPEYLSLVRNTTVLNASETSAVSVAASPSCGDRFSGQIKIKAFSDNAYSESTPYLEVTPIAECYDIRIRSEDNIKMGFSERKVPIEIVHEGIKAGDYSIGIEAENWISADAESFELEPGNTHSFNVIANPGNISEGNYYADINIKVKNVIYKKQIKFNIKRDRFNFWEFINFYRYWVYAGILALALLVFLAVFLKERARVWKIRSMIRKSMKNGKKKNKKEESKEKKKAKGKKPKGRKKLKIFWVYFIAILLLMASAYFLRHSISGFLGYVWFFFLTYIWYIVTGILLLIAVIFILNFIDKK
ncbi:hypothetical protein GF323_02415 [Candidatus Woesearchaeota archaeon]|nr:hypothetical protein [Candidatus Woesearchaeota archaeon]